MCNFAFWLYIDIYCVEVCMQVNAPLLLRGFEAV